MEQVRNRIETLLAKLNERVYGKEHVIALSLLSAMAGESIFLLGPPGVAKSMVARRLKLAFRQGETFEYLMSRFSTPDELFGPVSISKLKDEDTYERLTAGYLPSATVVFLDEIWKAGPAIQNALLTVINEKIYRNGQFSVKVPMKGLIAASNELPALGQGLEALWDRFLVRLLVAGVSEPADFDRMILSTDESDPIVDEELAISDAEYAGWQQQLAEVRVPYVVLEVIHGVKEKIEEYNLQLRQDEGTDRPLYVSDRRWKKLVKLLRTAAFLNGAEEVHLSDLLLLAHCLWDEVTQIDTVTELVQNAVRQSASGYLLNLTEVDRELKILRRELDSQATVRESHDPGLQLVDNYYYQVERVRMAGRLLMFASDYQQLDDTGKLFYLHKDKYKTDCFILKKYDLSMRNRIPQNKIYTLKRGRRSVFINQYEYPLLCTPDCVPLPPIEVHPEEDITARFHQIGTLLDRVEGGCKEWVDAEAIYCREHLFLDESEKKALLKILDYQLADVTRYRNEWEELNHAYRKENQEYPSERAEDNLLGKASR